MALTRDNQRPAAVVYLKSSPKARNPPPLTAGECQTPRWCCCNLRPDRFSAGHADLTLVISVYASQEESPLRTRRFRPRAAFQFQIDIHGRPSFDSWNGFERIRMPPLHSPETRGPRELAGICSFPDHNADGSGSGAEMACRRRRTVTRGHLSTFNPGNARCRSAIPASVTGVSLR